MLFKVDWETTIIKGIYEIIERNLTAIENG